MTTEIARLRTPLAIAVLTLLAERPRHVYEMKTVMRERGHDAVIRLAGGSIYDTLERLEESGLVKALHTSRQGKRPERTVYAITKNGQGEVEDWVRDLIARPTKEYPDFAVALAFVLILEKKDEVIMLLEARAAAIAGEIAARDTCVRRTAKSFDIELPRVVTIETEYQQAMLRAELAWIRKTAKELREGTLEWPTRAKLERLAAAADRRRGQ